MRLTAPDLACLVADSPKHPLDYALILHFERSEHPPFSPLALERGAESARQAFPVAGSVLESGRLSAPVWTPAPGHCAAPTVRMTSEEDSTPLIDGFLAPRFRLEEEPPLRQLLAAGGDPPRWSLVTRIHHAASDLIGALLFIRRQLRVAQGEEVPPKAPQRSSPLLQLRPERPARNPDSRPSTPLATRPAPRGSARRFRTFRVPRLPSSGPRGGFRWNDALLAAALEALASWNDSQGSDSGGNPSRRNHTPGASKSRIGLWVPMNIRRERFHGFGNGASRLRIHREPLPSGSAPSFEARCRAVRRTIDQKKRAGEWALPAWTPPAALARAAAPLLARWLDRPWADYGTAGFTHLGRWPGDEDPVFRGLEAIEVVACLHRRHPLYFAGMSHAGRTWVTITWDPALLAPQEIDTIAASFTNALSEPATGGGAPLGPPASE